MRIYKIVTFSAAGWLLLPGGTDIIFEILSKKVESFTAGLKAKALITQSDRNLQTYE